MVEEFKNFMTFYFDMIKSYFDLEKLLDTLQLYDNFFTNEHLYNFVCSILFSHD